MNFSWNYGNRILNLPAAALEKNATPEQLRLLLLLANGIADPEELSSVTETPVEKIQKGLAFWEEAGILTQADQADQPPQTPEPVRASRRQAEKAASPAKSKKLSHADEIPNYSVVELNEIMDRRQSLRSMVDEAQQIFGKMFNTYEINLLLGMVDYLNLDEDYILLLLAHCKQIEKTGLRSVERYAISLIDRGITTASALEENIHTIEEQYLLEKKVRSMFGMKNRSLTAKEQSMISDWMSYGYGEDVVRRAYEITVDSIREPSMKYTHAILQRWHEGGLKTLDDVNRAEEAARSAKGIDRNLSAGTSSFDTDEFFKAALKRGFEKPEAAKPDEANKEANKNEENV